MPTVQEILNTRILDPTLVFRPGYNAPIRGDLAFSRTNPGYTLDPVTGQVEEVPSGEVRIFGGQQSALLRGFGLTNETQESARFGSSNYDRDTAITEESGAEFLVDGGDPYVFSSTDSSGTVYRYNDGNVTDEGLASMSVIIEEPAGFTLADQTGFQARIDGDMRGDFFYDWVNEEAKVKNYGKGAAAYELFPEGPNGGRLILAVGYFNVQSGDGGGSWNTNLFPDRQGVGNASIYHSVQISNSRAGGFPVQTFGTPTTSDGALLNFDTDPSFWNPREGTFLLDFVPMLIRASFEGEGGIIDDGNYNNLWFNLDWNSNDYIQALISDDSGTIKKGFGGEIKPFVRHRAAISMNDNGDARVSWGEAGGTPNTSEFIGALNGNHVSTGTWNIGRGDPVLINEVRYIPDFLPLDTLEVYI